MYNVSVYVCVHVHVCMSRFTKYMYVLYIVFRPVMERVLTDSSLVSNRLSSSARWVSCSLFPDIVIALTVYMYVCSCVIIARL